MRKLPSTTGPDSYGETSGEAGDSSAAPSGKAFYQDLINKANTVPLKKIFKSYRLRIDEHNRRTTCPFKSHKGGHENSASFWFYPETNSFYCYGCSVGGPHAHASEFVAAMEEISRAKAAYSILEKFSSDIDEDGVVEGPDFSERLEIMMDFSHSVRNFRLSNTDEKSAEFIEEICALYDNLNAKHDLNNEALHRIVNLLKEKIIFYRPCLSQ